jgi:hypothetical protein
MKRGRKPKAIVESARCSPVGKVDAQRQITPAPMMIELIPLNPSLTVKFAAPVKQREGISLEQSRMDLQRLLSGIGGQINSIVDQIGRFILFTKNGA